MLSNAFRALKKISFIDSSHLQHPTDRARCELVKARKNCVLGATICCCNRCAAIFHEGLHVSILLGALVRGVWR